MDINLPLYIDDLIFPTPTSSTRNQLSVHTATFMLGAFTFGSGARTIKAALSLAWLNE